jgi:type IV secretion system protein VirD4
MTCESDYDPKDTGFRKRAIFVILPDEKTTYYSLAALLVSQHYIEFVRSADRVGGRLDNRVNVLLEEFGNFVEIPDFPTKLTVGGGRGVRFYLFLQAFAQLENKYGKEVSAIIKGNCENWIYLQSDDPETLKEFSVKLDKYTISTYGLTSNHQKYNNPSSSSNMSLTGRDLLTISELQDIKRPYLLLTSRNKPVIMELPDLSKWHFNKMFGLGSKKHNIRVRMYRDSLRSERKSTEMALWGIWKKYQQQLSFGGSKGSEVFREQVLGSQILEKHIRKEESYD